LIPDKMGVDGKEKRDKSRMSVGSHRRLGDGLRGAGLAVFIVEGFLEVWELA
jgi:hypothetical protein